MRVLRLIASASIGVFRSAAKVKALPERRGGWLGSNEGEAEGVRVVEIAQRYDLDRRYTAKTSGWQALEEFERQRASWHFIMCLSGDRDLELQRSPQTVVSKNMDDRAQNPKSLLDPKPPDFVNWIAWVMIAFRRHTVLAIVASVIIAGVTLTALRPLWASVFNNNGGNSGASNGIHDPAHGDIGAVQEKDNPALDASFFTARIYIPQHFDHVQVRINGEDADVIERLPSILILRVAASNRPADFVFDPGEDGKPVHLRRTVQSDFEYTPF